jgi:hypothetical protein
MRGRCAWRFCASLENRAGGWGLGWSRVAEIVRTGHRASPSERCSVDYSPKANRKKKPQHSTAVTFLGGVSVPTSPLLFFTAPSNSREHERTASLAILIRHQRAVARSNNMSARLLVAALALAHIAYVGASDSASEDPSDVPADSTESSDPSPTMTEPTTIEPASERPAIEPGLAHV